MPRMTHPDLPDQPIDVHPDAVGVRAKSGWVLEQDTPTAPKARARVLGPDVAAGDAATTPASAGTHEE